MDTIREFSYLEAGNLDWNEPRPKANNNKRQICGADQGTPSGNSAFSRRETQIGMNTDLKANINLHDSHSKVISKLMTFKGLSKDILMTF